LLNSGYVGVTKNPEIRFSQHGWRRKKSNAHLRNALLKHKDQIQFVVLAKDLDFEAACLLEEMLRPTENIGWNIAKGGSIPPNPKGKERSLAYRNNISKAKAGIKNPMYGKKLIFSEQHRKRISLSCLGRERTDLQGKKRPVVTCPNCGVAGGLGAMNRWHFDKCRDTNAVE
jgi:hypothetical protein